MATNGLLTNQRSASRDSTAWRVLRDGVGAQRTSKGVEAFGEGGLAVAGVLGEQDDAHLLLGRGARLLALVQVALVPGAGRADGAVVAVVGALARPPLHVRVPVEVEKPTVTVRVTISCLFRVCFVFFCTCGAR